MSAERILRECVQQMAGTHLKDKVKFVDCNVDTIDLDAGTCNATPIGEDAPVQIININLESEVADGLLIVPVVGSTITVFYSTRNLPYILKYSDIDKIYYSGNLFQFGDGSAGGMVKIADLTLSLNQLVTELQAQLALIATGITGVGGAYVPGTLSTFSKSDYEDTNVTHGQ